MSEAVTRRPARRSYSGITASGDSLILAAGIPVAEGQVLSLVAYRLGG